ncbi:MAG: hypothetical protein KF875_02305 [Trueperaceae bacterium]|nr:hypothetical protein [Trueperaceae bacterium]MCO5172947.1 hypothetical protein [Trueperaceae bacterium]MCW5820733.1 hypothetical protein [Trueperaceae bacterium]
MAGERDGRSGNARRVPPRELLRLILASYAASLPYVVLFVVVMLVATWLLTAVLR